MKLEFESFDTVLHNIVSMYFSKKYPCGVDIIKPFKDEEKNSSFEEIKIGYTIRIYDYYLQIYTEHRTDSDALKGYSTPICEVTIGKSKAKRIPPEEFMNLIENAQSIKRKRKINKLLT